MKICYKLLELKGNKKKNDKCKKKYSSTMGKLHKSNIHVMVIPNREERKKDLFEVTLAGNFPK